MLQLQRILMPTKEAETGRFGPEIMSTGRAWTHCGLFCPVHWCTLRPVNGSRFSGRFRVFLGPFLIYHPLPPLGPWSSPFNVPVVDSLGGPWSARPKEDACLPVWSRSFRQPRIISIESTTIHVRHTTNKRTSNTFIKNKKRRP
jgi:hypothetical protein